MEIANLFLSFFKRSLFLSHCQVAQQWDKINRTESSAITYHIISFVSMAESFLSIFICLLLSLGHTAEEAGSLERSHYYWATIKAFWILLPGLLFARKRSCSGVCAFLFSDPLLSRTDSERQRMDTPTTEISNKERRVHVLGVHFCPAYPRCSVPG